MTTEMLFVAASSGDVLRVELLSLAAQFQVIRSSKQWRLAWSHTFLYSR